jgi:1-acyl-sn-glycerol-3-phosphate acyltransferase
MLPPRLIRRLVLAPLVIVIAFGFIVLSPFLALAALASGLLARPRAGRMRSLRLVGFALVWLVAETAALIMLAGLWVVSGFGGRLRTEPYQSRHYGVMRWFLDTMYRGAERTYGLRVEVDEPELTGDELAARLTRPVIVLCRHAGPGDSFLLVHQLLSVYHRRPRVVMKAALQLDPSVDIVGNRLPNVWIKSRQAGEHIFTEQIARLARGLDERGALVIFPEGGNWTPGRWRRGIRRLEQLGRPDLAERARDMPNLLPPRPGGALAAIAACPDADVIFVAHAGLDNIITVGDVWSKFPVDQVIRARWWRVPDDSVPRSADHEAQVQWLYGWWERIDAWITENRPGMALAPLANEKPAGELPDAPHGGASPPGHRPGKMAAWNVYLESAGTSCGLRTRRPWARGTAIAWAWTPTRTACGVREPARRCSPRSSPRPATSGPAASRPCSTSGSATWMRCSRNCAPRGRT